MGTLTVALLVVLEPADAQSPLERWSLSFKTRSGLLRNPKSAFLFNIYSLVSISSTQHRVGPSRSSVVVVVVVFNINDSSSSQGFLLNPRGIPTEEMLLCSSFYR